MISKAVVSSKYRAKVNKWSGDVQSRAARPSGTRVPGRDHKHDMYSKQNKENSSEFN